MKKVITIILLLGLCLNSKAQVNFDLIAGLHSYNLKVADPSTIKAGINDANYGIHAGVKVGIELASLFIEPGLIFNSVTAKYTLDNPDTPEIESSSLNFDIPAVIGFKFSLVKIFAGPVAHLRFNNYQELIDEGQYQESVSKAFFGAQLGVGLTLNQIGFDLRYESNFKNEELGALDLFNQIRLVDSNSRIMFSLVYTLKMG